MQIEKPIKLTVLVLLFLASGQYGRAEIPTGSIYDVRNYDAVGDGQTINTAAIQEAIDDCHASGGGSVYFSGGNYVTGTLFLKSNVILYVEAGASLSGSKMISDYAPNVFRNQYAREPHMDRCLIFAENASNIGIAGNGQINGQGERSNFPNPGDPNKYRPMLIRFLRCENISLQGIRLLNPACWTVAMIYCKHIDVQGVTIKSRVNHNGDGLDFDGCEYVTINNCVFDTSDDSICLQASSKDHPCRYFTITNCIMSSHWAGMRIGMLSIGDFYDVTVDNCVFHNITDAALKIQMLEGGRMENFIFSNLVMKEVTRAVLMTFNNYTVYVDGPEEPAPMQTMKNFMFSNFMVETRTIREDDVKPLILITGLPGHRIENLSFSNFTMTGPGGGTASDGLLRTIPELDLIRPEFFQFGEVVPAHGIYARHVEGLYMDNLFMDTATPDGRPAVICDDVINMELSESRFSVAPDAICAVRLQNVKQAWIRNCRPMGDNKTFLQVEGKGSDEILLTGNDLRGFKESFVCNDCTDENVVSAISNIR